MDTEKPTCEVVARSDRGTEAGFVHPADVSPIPGDDTIAREFAELTTRWKRDTRYSSKASEMVEHPAYREIIGMGETAIPLILADLEKNGGKWFVALEEITRQNPVRAEDAGRIKKLTATWLAWGKAQGYSW